MTADVSPLFWTHLPPGPLQPDPLQPGPLQPGPLQPGPLQPGLTDATPAAVPATGLAPSLDSIGAKFGSDRASGHHGFLNFYERFLADLRTGPVSVLEIGVHGGEAARMWEEYFPAGTIVGVDHRPECLAVAAGRITVAICAEADVMRWVQIANQNGPFDLVVDDGTHMWESQIAALRAFYPFVRPGGFYILEDIDTSFGGYVPAFGGNARMSAAAYLRMLNDFLVGGTSDEPEARDDAFLKSAAAATDFLIYFRRTALLRRRPE